MWALCSRSAFQGIWSSQDFGLSRSCMAFAIARFRLRRIKELLVFNIPRKLNEDMCVFFAFGWGNGVPSFTEWAHYLAARTMWYSIPNRPPGMVLAPKLQLTMPRAGSSNFCGCKPLLTTKKQRGQRHPPAGVDDQKPARPKARKPHKTNYKTDWRNTQNRQNRTVYL